MPTTILYRTAATAEGGGRDGVATIANGQKVVLCTPRELGGSGGPGHNPEELLATGYAACFLGSLKAVASQADPHISSDASVTAVVGIGPRREGGLGLEIELRIHLPGMDSNKAWDLVERAHKFCPYSHALGSAIDIKRVLV